VTTTPASILAVSRTRRGSVGTRGPLLLVSIAVATAVTLGSIAAPAGANHSWGSYHWARAQNPFTLRLGDNVTTAWDAYLTAASADWSRDQADPSWPDATPPPAGDFVGPNPLNTTVVTGGTTGRRCRATTVRIEICNAKYGNNGWLGVATIWASGSHITQATVKLNDTYYVTAKYNTPAWRQSVLCQEVGHTYGLDHQDESGADLDTCMDYSVTPNIHPDQHDYNQLARIYQHTDSSTGGSVQTSSGSSSHGLHRVRDDLYVKDRGGNKRLFVWVYWKNHGHQHKAPADTP
jgi:hypothetical protein